MKLVLALIMCSAVNSTCLPPIDTKKEFDTWYDCSVAGYQESLDLLKESSFEEVNKHELYVKFFCYDKLTEEDT